MKVLVTGANGFLGQHLCVYLKNKNLEVIGAGRNASRIPAAFNVPFMMNPQIRTGSLEINFLILKLPIMTKKTRRKFSSDFKAKVVLEAFKERSTIEELARKYELHPTQINNWKKEAVANMASVFGGDKTEDQSDAELQKEKLYAQIGQLKVENDFLKKKLF